MIEIKEIIKNLPVSRKRGYLGKYYIKALTEYYNNYGGDEIDLDDLILRNFPNLILKNDIINDIKLFSPNELGKIFNLEVVSISNSVIRKKIIDYFDIKYEVDPDFKQVISEKSNCEILLHDFQERIRRKVINLIFNNQKRFLIHMPTGAGKTRTAAEIIVDFIRFSSSRALLSEKIKILWIAQSSELCFQAYETVKFILDKKGTQNINFGHFYENNELPINLENESAIIFCGIQKLLQHYNEDIWNKIRNDNYLVIVDEAHRSVATEWIQALDFFVANTSVYLLGLTATPGTGILGNENNYILSTYYNGNKITITDSDYNEMKNPISYLVQKKFLAKINQINIDSYIPISDKVQYTESHEFKFTPKTLNELTVSHTRNASIINIIKDNYNKNKKILVFTCGLEHNRILQSILYDLDIISETVDQNTKNRSSIIDRFKHGNLNILLNYGVLTTGFDAPKTDVCIIARPIGSIVMYSQMVGRILRGPLNNGNEENTLYTIKDNLGLGDYDNLFNSFNDYYK